MSYARPDETATRPADWSCSCGSTNGELKRLPHHLLRLRAAKVFSPIRGFHALPRHQLSQHRGYQSETVGCIWTARCMTVYVALAYIKSRMQWITSSPPVPRIEAPRINLVSASTRTFIKPAFHPFRRRGQRGSSHVGRSVRACRTLDNDARNVQRPHHSYNLYIDPPLGRRNDRRTVRESGRPH